MTGLKGYRKNSVGLSRTDHNTDHILFLLLITNLFLASVQFANFYTLSNLRPVSRTISSYVNVLKNFDQLLRLYVSHQKYIADEGNRRGPFDFYH